MEDLNRTSELARLIGSPSQNELSPSTLANIGWIRHEDTVVAVGLSRSTLQRLRSSGQLPYAKLGRKLFYRLADLCDMLDAADVRAPGRSCAGGDGTAARPGR